MVVGGSGFEKNPRRGAGMQDTVVEGEVEEQSREVEKPCMAGRDLILVGRGRRTRPSGLIET